MLLPNKMKKKKKRILGDIIHYVRANEFLFLSLFLRVQGENKTTFSGHFTGK